MALLSSSQKAINKHTIARAASKIKTNLLLNSERSEKFGKINTAPIQPAERLVNSEDKTLSLDTVSNIPTKKSVDDNQNSVNYSRDLAI